MERASWRSRTKQTTAKHTWHAAQRTHLSHLSAWMGRLGIAISRLGILLVSLGFDRFPVECAAKRSLNSALV